jgi:crossover junction endodeoxyribonuclease RuvC
VSDERIPGRILGVDPGSYATGWGVLGIVDRKAPSVIACGLVSLPRAVRFELRLHRLHDAIAEVVARTHPDLACVEAPFHGVNPRSSLQLAHARGVVLAALGAAGVRVEEVPPATVKQVVTGSGRAAKAQVQSMIRRVLGITEDLASEDVSDALAVAYCWAVHATYADNLRRAGGPASPGLAPRPRRTRGPVVRRAR